jgi:transcriptional regulator with XRE-family HTH domain
LKRGGSPANQAQLQSTVDQAQAALNSAKAKLDEVKNGGIELTRRQLEQQRQAAQATLVQAQGNLQTAKAYLAAVQNGSLDARVKSAGSNVTAARQTLNADQAKLQVVQQGPTDEDVQQAQAAVDKAGQALTRRLRLAAGITQLVLADRAGLSARSIQHLEAGMGQPNRETLRVLADALDLDRDERATFEAAGKAAPRRRGHPEDRHALLPPENRTSASLPVPLTSFIGHEQDLDQVEQLLSSHRLVTLLGAGGLGSVGLQCCENDSTPPSGGGCVRLIRFECDLVAQVLEALNETALDALATTLIEVEDAKILIHLRSSEQVVDDDQNGVAKRDGSFLLSAPSSQTTILRSRVRTAASTKRMCRLDERGA